VFVLMLLVSLERFGSGDWDWVLNWDRDLVWDWVLGLCLELDLKGVG
jgi:hypothetical protein